MWLFATCCHGIMAKSRAQYATAIKSFITRLWGKKNNKCRSQYFTSYLLSSSSSISIFFLFAALPGAELSSLESWATRILWNSSCVSSLLVLTAAALAFRSSIGMLFIFSAFKTSTKEQSSRALQTICSTIHDPLASQISTQGEQCWEMLQTIIRILQSPI